MKIIPRKTRVRCKDCGHVFIKRNKMLGVCPRCWHKNIEIVDDNLEAVNEFTVMRVKLGLRA